MDGLHLSEIGYKKIANIWYKYTIDILRALAGETQPNPSPSSTPNTTKTIKIMPVGDSCTEGMVERDGFLPYGIVQTVDTSRAQY